MTSRTIKLVTFDAGGTLIHPRRSVGELYAHTASEFGMSVSPADVERLFAREFSSRCCSDVLLHPSDETEKAWWKELVTAIFSALTSLRDFDAFFETLFLRFAEPGSWGLFPDAIPALEALRRSGVNLGIVSNFDSRLLSLCTRLGLDKYFSFILASAVVGSAKPDTGIFLEALKRGNVEPHESLHVGDDVAADVKGARRVGIRAVLVRRDGSGESGVTTVTSLVEVVHLVT